MEKQKIKINLKIITIIILSIIGLTLMYLSTTNKNIDIKYEFYKQVNSTTDIYNYNLKIGEIKITNNGIMPVKTYLKKFIGCINKTTNYLEYTQSNKDYSQVFSYSNGKPYIEISKGETKTLSIISTNIPVKYDFEGKPMEKDINYPQTIYVFETMDEEDPYNYNYCIDADLNNAVEIIQIN